MARTATKKSGADAPKTINVGGRVLRARTPDEWSIKDNESVLRYGFILQRELLKHEDKGESGRMAAICDTAIALLEQGGGALNAMLACGLWPDGVPYSEAAAVEHEDFIHGTTFVFNTELGRALGLAIGSFMPS